MEMSPPPHPSYTNEAPSALLLTLNKLPFPQQLAGYSEQLPSRIE